MVLLDTGKQIEIHNDSGLRRVSTRSVVNDLAVESNDQQLTFWAFRRGDTPQHMRSMRCRDAHRLSEKARSRDRGIEGMHESKNATINKSLAEGTRTRMMREEYRPLGIVGT